MALFAVIYRYSDDTASLDEHRPAHREYIRSRVGNGVVASGPMTTSEGSGALIVCTGEDEAEVRSMLDADPFWGRGLITAREIAPWNLVMGSIGLEKDD
jgi:uncharacterized protein YciI